MTNQSSKKKSTKLSINLPEADAALLRELADSGQTTMTEVLRRALRHEKRLTDELESKSQVFIVDKDGKAKELVGWV
jgi:hypothetical protein